MISETEILQFIRQLISQHWHIYPIGAVLYAIGYRLSGYRDSSGFSIPYGETEPRYKPADDEAYISGSLLWFVMVPIHIAVHVFRLISSIPSAKEIWDVCVSSREPVVRCYWPGPYHSTDATPPIPPFTELVDTLESTFREMEGETKPELTATCVHCLLFPPPEQSVVLKVPSKSPISTPMDLYSDLNESPVLEAS